MQRTLYGIVLSFIMCMLFPMNSRTQEHDIISMEEGREYLLLCKDTILNANTIKPEKKKTLGSILGRGVESVTNFFMGCDTSYITPQLYEFTAQADLSIWHDFYFMRSSVTKNSMNIQSDPSLVLGGYIYWSIFGYGHSVNLHDIGRPEGEHNGTSQRNSFVLNTARVVAEVYTFNSGKTAKITSLTDYDFKGKDRSFSGLSSKCFGINAEYIFNHRRYSWPAAFGENAVQRRSCGSWKIGFSYNHQKVSFNKNELPDYLQPVIDTTLLFNKVDYKDYGISIGYGYNWVVSKNCLLAISLLPSIGYRKSNITDGNESKFTLKNISTDFIVRASFFWNNTKFFVGTIAELHTYSYRESKFGLTNTYGTFKFVYGFNFLKKSQYRKKD